MVPGQTDARASTDARKDSRKTFLFAAVTIVFVVGLTLLLFFVGPRSAGKAIDFGFANEAAIGTAGIFIGGDEVVGEEVVVPILANLGDEKSTGVVFRLTFEPGLSAQCDGIDLTVLDNLVMVQEVDLSVIKRVDCDNVDHFVEVEYALLFSPDTNCANALSGENAELARIPFVSLEEGTYDLGFDMLDVFYLYGVTLVIFQKDCRLDYVARNECIVCGFVGNECDGVARSISCVNGCQMSNNCLDTQSCNGARAVCEEDLDHDLVFGANDLCASGD